MKFDSRTILAYITTIAAILFGVAGTWIAPCGIIDSSMLYMIAQLLIFAATLMGFGATIAKVSDMISGVHNHNNNNKQPKQ